ncbi:MAG: 2OG-Fe(II) oxygenase family protein, partial [Myxococcota bacterium]
FASARRFFALPEATKARIAKRESPSFRGWEPLGSELTNGQPDLREQVDLWSEHGSIRRRDPVYLRLHGENPWLPEDVLPGHRSVIIRWLEALDDVATHLLDALGVGLGLPRGHLLARFGTERMSLLKLIHYRATPAGGAGVNPHHDTGFLTLLAADRPGLEIEGPDGRWHSVPIHPSGFVVNLGELLQIMTGNYLLATPHRVVAAEERISLGYFHGPSLDMPLTPLTLHPRYAEAVAASPRHDRAGFMAPKEEVERGAVPMTSRDVPERYGEQLWRYFERSYPELVARHHPDRV